MSLTNVNMKCDDCEKEFIASQLRVYMRSLLCEECYKVAIAQHSQDLIDTSKGNPEHLTTREDFFNFESDRVKDLSIEAIRDRIVVYSKFLWQAKILQDACVSYLNQASEKAAREFPTPEVIKKKEGKSRKQKAIEDTAKLLGQHGISQETLDNVLRTSRAEHMTQVISQGTKELWVLVEPGLDLFCDAIKNNEKCNKKGVYVRLDKKIACGALHSMKIDELEPLTVK